MAKSWLDVQIDLEVTRSLPGGGVDQLGTFGDVMDRSPGQVDGSFDPSNGPENWPIQVLNQQPRQLSSLLQKLHSGYLNNSYHICSPRFVVSYYISVSFLF